MRNAVKLSLAAAASAIALGYGGLHSAKAADIPAAQGEYQQPPAYGPPPSEQGYGYPPPVPYGYPPPAAYYPYGAPPVVVVPGAYYAGGPYGYRRYYAGGYGPWGYGRWGYWHGGYGHGGYGGYGGHGGYHH